MYSVVTTEGALLTKTKIGGGDLDQTDAEARCKQANDEAEKLGIKTRYEVREK